MKKYSVILRSVFALFLAVSSLGAACFAQCGLMVEGQSCTMSCAHKNDMVDTKGQAEDAIVSACCCGAGKCQISQAPATVPQTASIQAPFFETAIQGAEPVLAILVLRFRSDSLGSPIGSSRYLSVQHSFANAPPKV